MSDISNITAAGKAIAAFKSTQALSRAGDQAVRRPQVEAAAPGGPQPERTLRTVRPAVVQAGEQGAAKSVHVGDRRLAVRGSIIDILV